MYYQLLWPFTSPQLCPFPLTSKWLQTQQEQAEARTQLQLGISGKCFQTPRRAAKRVTSLWLQITSRLLRQYFTEADCIPTQVTRQHNPKEEMPYLQ